MQILLAASNTKFKQMRSYIIVLIGVLSFASCASKKESNTTKMDEIKGYLIFGQGGGFTGAYQEYILRPNGEVEKWNEREGRSEKTGKIAVEEARTAFDTWATLIEEIGPINTSPGNMNYRITRITDEGEVSIRWSDAKVPSAIVDEYYRKYYLLLLKAREVE